jgi:hypothetical protein
VVVIDTISRAVGGEENDNDTWLNFYQYTAYGSSKPRCRSSASTTPEKSDRG